MKKVLIIIAISLFLVVTLVSALGEKAKIISNKEVKITDLYGFGDDIVKYKLTKSENSIIDAYAEGEAILYKDGLLFDKLDFYDKSGSSRLINYQIFYSSQEVVEEKIPVYKKQCQSIKDTKNGSEVCKQEIVDYTSQFVIKDVSHPYKFESLKAGTYKWRIEAHLPKPNVAIDWVPTSNNVKLPWAWWADAWGRKKKIDITELSGKILYNYTINVKVLFDADMDINMRDIRFVDSTETNELYFWNDSITPSTNGSFWVKIPTIDASANTSIYMYYSNPDATPTTNNNITRAFIIGDDFEDGIVNTDLWENYVVEYTEKDGIFKYIGANGDIRMTTMKGYNFTEGIIETSMGAGGGQAQKWIAMVVFYTSALAFYNIGSGYAAGGIVMGHSFGNDIISYGSEASYTWNVSNRWTVRKNQTFTNITNDLLGSQVSTDDVYRSGQMGPLAYNRGQYWDWFAVRNYSLIEPIISLGTEQQGAKLLTVILLTPPNYYNSSNPQVTFNCSSNSSEGVINLTLFINNVTNYSILNSTPYENISLQITRGMLDGFHTWTCRGLSNTVSTTAAERNLTIDTIFPIFNWTFPPHTLFNLSTIPSFATSINWTVQGSSNCVLYNGTINQSVSCSANSSKINISWATQNYTFTMFYNDSVGNTNHTDNLVSYVGLVINSTIYNTTTYETALEPFVFNLLSDGSRTITGYLVYNGVSYLSTKSGTDTNTVFTNTIDISTITGTANLSFYWNISYGGTYFSTATYSHTVTYINFNLCNNTFRDGYLNITFADESTLAAMNGSIDSSTWVYSLGNGNVNKTFLFANTSQENVQYAFCFDGRNRTLHKSVELHYSLSGYPQRRWVDSSDLTITTPPKILYLLSGSVGTYSVYVVQNQYGYPVPGVDVTAQRLISGTWYTMEQGTTDTAGAVTFWLNTNFDHKLTFTKVGYNTQIVTVRPSSSTYTVTMTTGGETGATFNASIEGLNWKTGVSPSESSLKPNTVYTFWVNFTTNTSLSSIAACKFELLNNNSVVLATISGCLGTGGIGGNISTTLNTSDNRSIRMRISVDMGSGYWIIDADSYWLVLTFDYPTRGTLKDFITYSKDWSIWGDGDRGEISKVLAFFLIFTIVLGFLSYTTNWDLVTGGGNIMLFLPVIWFASAYGFFNLSYQPENVVLPVVGNIGAFMNRYTIALFASMLSLGYIFNKIGDGGR